MKGTSIGNSEVIREVHNAFARPELFVGEQVIRSAKDEDAYHFVAYIPHNGVVYELDGLKSGPIIHGSYDNKEKWISIIKPVIENRMHRASTHFNLLSIQKSRSKLLQEELGENADINQRNEILSKLSAHQSLRESQRLENERRDVRDHGWHGGGS